MNGREKQAQWGESEDGMLTLRVRTKPWICSMGTVFGGVFVLPDLVHRMKDMSRMGLTGGHVKGYASAGESESRRGA